MNRPQHPLGVGEIRASYDVDDQRSERLKQSQRSFNTNEIDQASQVNERDGSDFL